MIRDFKYLAPKTLKEALSMLDKYQDDYKIIAGGQSLLILMKHGLVAPEYLINIKGLSELDYIKYDAGEGLKIGALTTHRSIEKSDFMKNGYGVLAETENKLASIQTRNWGSIGGNLCHADPAGDPMPVFIALKATLTVSSINGERTMPAEDFSLDYFENALEPNEMLTEIQVPATLPYTGTAYTKFNIIENDMPTVAAAVSITLASRDGDCQDARVVLGAASPTPVRAVKAEELLKGKKITDELLAEAGEIASTECEPVADIHASADYRSEVVKVLVKRMGKEALARAQKD